MKKRKHRIYELAGMVLLSGVLGIAGACAKPEDNNTLLLLAEAENQDSAQNDSFETGQDFGEDTAQEGPKQDTIQNVFVHICGEVAVPGVYEVAADSRIYEVLQMAGGFTQTALKECINLAAPVTDGMQIVIPSQTEAWQEEKEKDGRININTASVEELCTLPGIGESRAADIIAYRTANGSFKNPEELMLVNGIKTAVYEKLQDKICTE